MHVELGDYLEGLGVQNVIAFNKGGTVEVEGIRFTMVPASHSSSIGDGSGGIIYLGEANGYVVTLENGIGSTLPATPACSATWR